MSSPVFSGVMFDLTTLETVIAEHQVDVSAASSQSLVKAISSVLPSLVGKARRDLLKTLLLHLGWPRLALPSPTPRHPPRGYWLPLLGGIGSTIEE